MWKYICMVVKLFFPIISCWFKCRKYSKHKERYSLEERYNYVRSIAIKFNKVLKKDVNITNYEVMKANHSNYGRIYVCNHQSIDDIITLLAISEKNLIFISKKENKKSLFLRPIFSAIDVLYIDRNDPRQSIKVLKEAADLAYNQKMDVVLFPEGTRSKDLIVHEFKSALNNLVLNAKSEIVLIAIHNTTQTFKFKAKYKKYPVYVKIFNPMSYQYFLDNKKDFSKISQELISQQVEIFKKELIKV